MSRIVFTEGATRGLERYREFLAVKNPQASRRAGQAIEKQLSLLLTNPNMGSPFAAHPEFRELIIGFGDSGYVALYRLDADDNTIHVLAFRHQKEAGYA